MERASILESISSEEPAEGLVSLRPGEVIIGRLDALDEAGNATVSLPELPYFQQRIALSTVPLSGQHIGRKLALMFTQGDDPKPIIIGVIHSPLQQVLESVLANTPCDNSADELVFAEPIATSESTRSVEGAVYIDGKQLILEAQEEIVFRCGEASISLNKNGKIAIRGKYLLSRATGVNRILGGSVQVN